VGFPKKSLPAVFCRKSRGKPILLSFSTMRKKVSKACPEHFTSFSTGSVEGKESPTPLYRQIIKPQHLWLDCYFFFVSSNKEKVTKKKMPPSAVFFYTHSFFTLSWYSLDFILKLSSLHLCLSHVAVHSFIRKATAIHCGVLPLPFISFAEYPFLLLSFLCINSKGS